MPTLRRTLLYSLSAQLFAVIPPSLNLFLIISLPDAAVKGPGGRYYALFRSIILGIVRTLVIFFVCRLNAVRTTRHHILLYSTITVLNVVMVTMAHSSCRATSRSKRSSPEAQRRLNTDMLQRYFGLRASVSASMRSRACCERRSASAARFPASSPKRLYLSSSGSPSSRARIRLTVQ